MEKSEAIQQVRSSLTNVGNEIGIILADFGYDKNLEDARKLISQADLRLTGQVVPAADIPPPAKKAAAKKKRAAAKKKRRPAAKKSEPEISDDEF